MSDTTNMVPITNKDIEIAETIKHIVSRYAYPSYVTPAPAACPRCGKQLDDKTKQWWDLCNCESVAVGWRCPGCQRVFAPGVEECGYCNDR